MKVGAAGISTNRWDFRLEDVGGMTGSWVGICGETMYFAERVLSATEGKIRIQSANDLWSEWRERKCISFV